MTISTDLLIKITAQNAASATITGVQKELDGLKKKVLEVGAAFFSGLAIKNVIDSTMQWSEATRALQAETGLSAQSASRLNFVAQALGVSSDELNTSLGHLAKNMFSNSVEADKGKDAFTKWGIAIHDTDGSIRNVNDVLIDSARRVKELGDGAAARALEMDLFGKSGGRLHELLLQGAEGVQALANESDALGLTLNGSTLSAMRETDKNIRVFGLAIEGLKVQLGAFLLPVINAVVLALTRFFAWLRSATQAGGVLAGVIKVLGNAFSYVWGLIKGVADRLGAFVADIQKKGFVQAVVDLVKDMIDQAGKALGQVQDWASKTLPKWTDELGKLMGRAASWIVTDGIPTLILALVGGITAPKSVIDFISAWGEFLGKVQGGIQLIFSIIGLRIAEALINTIIDKLNGFGDLFNSTIGKLLGLSIPRIGHVSFEANVKDAEDALAGLLKPRTLYINSVIRDPDNPYYAPNNPRGGGQGNAVRPPAGWQPPAGGDYGDYAAAYQCENVQGGQWNWSDHTCFYPQGGGGGGRKAAAGAIVRARSGGTQMTVGEGGQDEAIIPLGKSGGMGATYITVNVSGNVTENEELLAERVGDHLMRAITHNRSVVF